MKKIPLFLLIFVHFTRLFAQNNDACDGSRYLNDVFTAVKKTTVQYATATTQTGGTMTLSVDIYEPQGDLSVARPLVLLAHGGSFIAGDKSMMQPYAELLAKKGYVVGAIQYRLWPFLFLGIPDSFKIMDTAVKAMGDMKAAARFFREDAATTNLYHIDANNVFFGGYSAGAVTALHAAYLDADDVLPAYLATTLAGNGGLNGNSGSVSAQAYPSDCKAVINMSGGIYRNNWLDTGEIPLTSIHGTADETVNYNSGLAANIAYLEGSHLVHQRAQSVDIPSYLETVEGAGHTNLYNNALYAAQLTNFWQKATTMMENIICASSSAPEVSAVAQNWSVAPNPSSGLVQISNKKMQNNLNVKVLNSLGQEVLTLYNINQTEQIDLGRCSKGVFMLQIMDVKNHTLATRRIVLE